MTRFPIQGVWATPNAREMFSEAERQSCVDDYEERGPQHFAQGAGFAFYEFADGRVLVLADKRGKCTLMTREELEEARRKGS